MKRRLCRPAVAALTGVPRDLSNQFAATLPPIGFWLALTGAHQQSAVLRHCGYLGRCMTTPVQTTHVARGTVWIALRGRAPQLTNLRTLFRCVPYGW